MKKLSTLLIMTITLCITITFIASNVFQVTSSLNVIKNNAKEHLETIAQQKGNELEMQLLQVSSVIDELASNAKVHMSVASLKSPNNQTYINDYMNHMAPIIEASTKRINGNHSLYFVLNANYTQDLEDLVYVATNEHQTDYTLIKDLTTKDYLLDNPNEHPWYFKTLASNQGIWIDPYKDTHLNRSVVTYAAPIIKNNTIIGLVGVDLLFDDFKEQVEQIQVYDTGYAFILGRDYSNLVHPVFSPDQTLSELEDGQFAFMQAYYEASDKGHIEYTFYGDKKILGFYRMRNGWILGVAPTYSAVYKDWNETLRLQIGIAFVGLLITLVITIYVTKKLTQPADQLSDYVNQITADNLDLPIPLSLVENKSELGTLAQNIDILRNRLDNAFDTLNQHNDVLEKKVVERTNELKVSNDQLVVMVNTLETLQNNMLLSEKSNTIKILVRGISQQLTSPITNAVTTLSFLQQQIDLIDDHLDDDAYTNVNDSLAMLNRMLGDMNTHVEKMKLLLIDYTNINVKTFNIYDVFSEHLLNMTIEQPHAKLNCIVRGDHSLELLHSKQLFERLVKHLFDLSIMLHVDIKMHTIEISYIKLDGAIRITLKDTHLAEIEDFDTMFNDYYFGNTVKSSVSLELHVLYDLVTRGLQGTLHQQRVNDSVVCIYVDIPAIDNTTANGDLND